MSTGVAFSELKQAVDQECSICQNTCDETKWVGHETDQKVQHVFHYKCLIDWAKNLWRSQREPTCPLCVKVIDIKTLAADADLDELITLKNDTGKEVEKRLNKYHNIFSIYTAAAAGAILSILDTAHVVSGYNIVGIATTSAIYFGSGIMGWVHMPLREFQPLAFKNSAFYGGLVAALHLIDPLSIGDLRAGFIYAGISAGISQLYLPGKVKFLPTNDLNYRHTSHSGRLVHLIGMATLFAWRCLR